jgi:hypothetical protein
VEQTPAGFDGQLGSSDGARSLGHLSRQRMVRLNQAWELL